MCDELQIGSTFWVRHVAFVQLLEALLLYMQQQMPKYLVLSWSICQFACVGMLQSILANISTFHVLSLTKN